MTYDDWKADVANREGSAPQDDPTTLEESVDALCCELCGEPCAGEDGRPCVMPDSMGAGVGGQTLMVCGPCYDLAARFDLSDLSGDSTPCSIHDFLEANAEFTPDKHQLVVQDERLVAKSEHHRRVDLDVVGPPIGAVLIAHAREGA